MRKIAIHQPQFIPYLGFFSKIAGTDVYVVLDDVKATQADFTNRNRVRGPTGAIYLTIPVRSKNITISEMKISAGNWSEKHIKSLQTFYCKTLYYDVYINDIIASYNAKKWTSIVDIDMLFLEWIFKILDIQVDILFSSDLNCSGIKNEKLINICKSLSADHYISGKGGMNYLETDLFKRNGITLKFQNFVHPVYSQKYTPFIPNLSIIDALFNCGEDYIKKIIGEGQRVQ